MRTTKAERRQQFLSRLADMGFSFVEAMQLRRIEMTLHRWAELECGDGNDYASWSIERDEATGKPFRHVYPHSGPSRRYPVPDREKGALRRLAGLLKAHPDFTHYHQTDPRGCALYLVRKTDIPAGAKLDSCYTRGFAVCE